MQKRGKFSLIVISILFLFLLILPSVLAENETLPASYIYGPDGTPMIISNSSYYIVGNKIISNNTGNVIYTFRYI